jgi:hypothetical protein
MVHANSFQWFDENRYLDRFAASRSCDPKIRAGRARFRSLARIAVPPTEHGLPNSSAIPGFVMCAGTQTIKGKPRMLSDAAKRLDREEP